MNSENQENIPLYWLFPSTTYKKELKKYLKQPTKLVKIKELLLILAEKGVDGVPLKLKPHSLIGNYKGCYECHIEPDLLLIWEQNEEEKEIVLHRIGSHSELFE